MIRTATVFCLLSLPLLADAVYFKDGRKVVGKIEEETDEYVKIARKGGSVKIKKYEISKIEKGPTPEEIFEDRKSRVDGTSASDLLALAEWCRKEKLKKEELEVLSQVLEIAPENEAAHLALGHVRHEGKWMTWAESCKARGLVEFEGSWMSAEEAKLKQALKEEAELEKKLSEKVREKLRKLVSADVEEREEARAALDLIPADLKFAPLLECVDHKSADIRAYCLGALMNYTERPEMLSKVARRVLVDESETIREIAADTLKKLNHPDSWIHLQKGLASEYPQIRVRAANALCRFPNEKAAEALLNALVKVDQPRGGTKIETRVPETMGGTRLSEEAKRKLAEGLGGDDPAEKAKEEMREKEKAAVVKALETCTGLSYGADVSAWRNWWLGKHAATAAGEGGREDGLPPEEKEEKK